MTLDQSNEHEPKRKPDTYQIDFAKASLPAALIPLTTQPRWVCWRWEWRKGKGTKGTWTKPPIQPGSGFPAYAKNNDPATWGTFNEAVQREAAHVVAGIARADQRLENRPAGERRHRGAVAGRLLGKVVGGPDAARARH